MILTASPIFDGEDSEAFRNAAAKKREWCRRHLGITDEHDFVCTVSWKKHNFVGYRPASVQLLIDDREKNCAEWERVGGVALRYTTWEETRPRLEALLRQFAPEFGQAPPRRRALRMAR